MDKKTFDRPTITTLILPAIGVTAAMVIATMAVLNYLKEPPPSLEETAKAAAEIILAAQRAQKEAVPQEAAPKEATPDNAPDDKEQRIRELTAAVEELRNTNAVDAARRAAAEKELKSGRTAAADAIFAELEKAGSQQATQAAKHRGAIAYMNQPQLALTHYQRAVGYDPEDADAWNWVGLLNWRLGEMAEAEAAFQRVRGFGERGEASADKQTLAMALGNLGLLAQTRGELAKAEDYHQRALALNEALGRKEGMAKQLGNLGLIARTRGELDKAEDYHQRSLALEEALGRKEGMAADLGNLGVLAQTRGELAKAKDLWRRALALFTEIGMRPEREKVAGWLREVRRSEE